MASLSGWIKLINKRAQADAEKAVVEFENAIRIDPSYAQGYIGLAEPIRRP